MLTRFGKVPVVAAFLAVAAIFITRGADLYGKDGNHLRADKENSIMTIGQTRPAIPPIDAAAPAKFQTATFALG